MEFIQISGKFPRELDVTGIYAIKHSLSNRFYVGSSVGCRDRLWMHRRALRKGNHHSRFLQAAWNKYGEKDFCIRILETSAREKLIEREQFWIDYLDSYSNGFNGRPVAEANYGLIWTEEQNEARRKSNKEAWLDPELRAQLSEMFKGYRRGKWTKASHEKASATLKKAHLANPEWRKLIQKTLSDPEINQRRLASMRKALKDPLVYDARVKQLHEASKSPAREQNLRATYFKKHHMESKGINSSEELDAACISMYEKGMSLRKIGSHFGIDHKSIASRLRRCGLEIKKRHTKGAEKPNSKLNEDMVREIRKLSAQGLTNAKLAEMFSVSPSIISEVKNYKRWKHVK